MSLFVWDDLASCVMVVICQCDFLHDFNPFQQFIDLLRSVNYTNISSTIANPIKPYARVVIKKPPCCENVASPANALDQGH